MTVLLPLLIGTGGGTPSTDY